MYMDILYWYTHMLQQAQDYVLLVSRILCHITECIQMEILVGVSGRNTCVCVDLLLVIHGLGTKCSTCVMKYYRVPT